MRTEGAYVRAGGGAAVAFVLVGCGQVLDLDALHSDSDGGGIVDVTTTDAPGPRPDAVHKGTSAGDSTMDSKMDGGCTPSAPVGGPGGYSTLVIDDTFGSTAPCADITSVTQFNPPNSQYGVTGTGWDVWSYTYGQSMGSYANVIMQPDYLEIDPTGTPGGDAGAPSYLVSHFAALPTATTSYYFEVKVASGRGDYDNMTGTWPRFLLYTGNGDQHAQRTGIVVMQTFADESDFSFEANSDGGYDTIATGNDDVTTTENVYGCELASSNGQVAWSIYFNGDAEPMATGTTAWSAPPAILLGWEYGENLGSPAKMKVAWARVWSK